MRSNEAHQHTKLPVNVQESWIFVLRAWQTVCNRTVLCIEIHSCLQSWLSGTSWPIYCTKLVTQRYQWTVWNGKLYFSIWNGLYIYCGAVYIALLLLLFVVVAAAAAPFLQRVSIACYAERCLSYDRFCLTDRPTVCHSPVSCQNDSSYDHAVFTGG